MAVVLHTHDGSFCYRRMASSLVLADVDGLRAIDYSCLRSCGPPHMQILAVMTVTQVLRKLAWHSRLGFGTYAP